MTAPQPSVSWQPPGPAQPAPPMRGRLAPDAVLALIAAGVAMFAALFALLVQQAMPRLVETLHLGYSVIGPLSTATAVVVMVIAAAAAAVGLVVVLRRIKAPAGPGVDRELVVGAIALAAGVMIVVPRFVGVVSSLAFAWLS